MVWEALGFVPPDDSLSTISTETENCFKILVPEFLSGGEHNPTRYGGGSLPQSVESMLVPQP